MIIFFPPRYAIGNAERPMLQRKIGWLDHLANATYQFYSKYYYYFYYHWCPISTIELIMVN